MITIDGSQGEGGGQVLRSSLALSLVTGQPFTITNIRAGRKKPGLMRQHLTAVTAAAEVGQAKVTGASLRSTELTFEPGEIQSGEYHFAVGTAGSATLVLQTVLPALLCAPGPSALRLEGGTHNQWAPPFDFLVKTFLPLVNRMGPTVNATLVRPGFYPVGGGEFHVSITPANALQPIELLERGQTKRVTATAKVAHLPRNIAERELRAIGGKLGLTDDDLVVEEVKDSRGPGNIVMIEIECEHVTELFTGFGERQVPAETVAAKATQQARRYLSKGVPVGEYLTDQLLIPLALAGGGAFRTLELSRHAQTNIEVIKAFLDVGFEIDRTSPPGCVVRVSR
ncbi:MAG: RNA 3'-terminal phosphate cyclase [Phycisphaerae bacterium]|nr:RNA 3'-terminal phosphate cyclase [Phycisphaerae bacterium]